jgi:hypothetical protein
MCRPGITIAGPDTITATSLPDLAQRITLAREAEIREASSVAVTYDGWKGGDEQGKVVGIVYHWLNKEWVPRHAALDLIETSSSQSSACLSILCLTYSQSNTCTYSVNFALTDASLLDPIPRC